MNQETAQNRKKVLFVVTKSNLGGAQRYVLDLAKNLPQGSYEALVACGPAQGSNEPGALFSSLKAAGIRTVFIPDLGRDVRIASDARALRDLYALFRAERPHIVHLNSSKAGGLGAVAATLAQVPRTVFTSHGLAYDEPRTIVARIAIRAATWMTFLLCDVVICISNDTARRASRLPFCSAKVRKIYNGIAKFTALESGEARAHIRTLDPDVSPAAFWIGTVSELVPNKGLGYALRVCEEIKRRGVNFAFLIIGEGDQRSALASTVERRGLSKHVRFLGFVPEASKYLRAFDLFALTSSKEGLPYVLLEAGVAGLPVVGTDIPGINDIIENGVSGALCSHKDPELCADAITEIIEDPGLRERFGASLKQRVATVFSFERMLAETYAAYEAR